MNKELDKIRDDGRYLYRYILISLEKDETKFIELRINLSNLINVSFKLSVIKTYK